MNATQQKRHKFHPTSKLFCNSIMFNKSEGFQKKKIDS